VKIEFLADQNRAFRAGVVKGTALTRFVFVAVRPLLDAKMAHEAASAQHQHKP